MKKIFSIFLLIIFSKINTMCSKQKLIGKIICEGYIYDSIGGNGAADVPVSLYACYPRDGRNSCDVFSLGSTTTDAAGHYKIQEKSARSGRYYISGHGIKYQELHSSDLKNNNYTTGYLKKQ